MQALFLRLKLLLVIVGVGIFTNSYAAPNPSASFIKQSVDQVIKPLMEKEQIPGMAVAVTINGQHYFFNYGVASLKTKKSITNQTLFQVGSITKTFTTTLASYLDVSGALSFSDDVVKYIPQLRGSAFDNVTLLNLATHTSGLPLFEPRNLQNLNQYLDYLRKWQPKYAIATRRVYSNNGIALLGITLGKVAKDSYEHMLSEYILQPLGLTQTYFILADGVQKNDAEGYAANDQLAVSNQQELIVSASGLKSCSKDLITYVEENMGEIRIPSLLQQAIFNTHIGYFNTPYLVQDLGWEQLPFPLPESQLLNGNSNAAIDSPAKVINPPLKADNVLIDKTGSTNGFATYILFVPDKKAGIVLLANKNYPISERVKAAYTILSKFVR